MSTQFTNRQWRLPNNENKDKQSNYSMDFLTTTRIPDITGLGLGTSVDTFSISLWFNKSNMNYGIVFSTYSGSGSYPSSGVAIDLNTDGTIAFYNGANRKTTSAQYSINTWYNLVVTSDGTTVKMYVNGSQVTLDSTTVVARDFTNVWINSAKYSASNFGIIGKIDAVSIFDYALSSSQITTLYGSSSTGIGNPMSLSPKPVAYYPLGDQDAFNGSSYLTPNSSLKDFVFDFDLVAGVGDLISATNTLPSSSDFTISLWVNPDSSQASYSTTIVFGNLVNGENLQIISRFGTGYFYVSNGSSAYISQSNAVQANVWTLITVTYNNTLGVLTAYLNGGENVYTSSSGTTLPTQAFGNLMYIGKYTTNSTSYQGKISNVQIFNSALPATGSNSVETLYNNGSPLTSMSGFTSLQGWWKLDASDTYDSSTGNWTIEDHAGSNDGTSSGMTQANLVQSDLSFTSGYSPYALDFDAASSDYISAPVTTLNSATQCTISFWGKKDASNKILCIGGHISNSQGIWLMWYSDGNIYFSPRGTGATSFGLTHSQSYDSNWHNYIGVYDGSSAANCKLYLDGNLVATGTGTPPASLPSTTGDNFQIGALSTSFYTDGQISNCSIWNTALTSSQVSEIYSEGVPQNLLNHSAVSSLVGWWQLGSNSSFNSSLNQWTCIDEKGTNTGESSQTFNEDAIVDGVGSYANGLSSGMGGDEVIGDAPYSTANALSVNMDVLDRVEDTPS